MTEENSFEVDMIFVVFGKIQLRRVIFNLKKTKILMSANSGFNGAKR